MTTWLLDAGNSRLKVAPVLADGGLGEVTTVDYAAAHDCLARCRSGDTAWVACVAAPDKRDQITAALHCTTHWATTPAQGLGLSCAYADHRKWGVDRFLALAAARQLTPGSVDAATNRGCAVISIGTATTLDICDARGRHLGGWIAPGPQALIMALGSNTALPEAAAARPDALRLATDTEDAILLGALQSAIGGIDRAVAVAQDMGIDELIITGGGVAVLEPYLHGYPLQHRPHLVLAGLRLYQR